jgi:hypothetical protein
MKRCDQTRRWPRIGILSLLGLILPGLALAQTDTSTSPKKPPATAAHTAKATHSTAAAASTKRTSAHKEVSAQKIKNSHGKKNSKSKPVAKKRGQQAIDSTRAQEIQTALIREHYMEGEPSGTWDSATQAAMQRYQADQGWQSKTTPDARALIKLGLGPSHDHLLNPESAMTTLSAPAASDPKAAAKPAADNPPPQ